MEGGGLKHASALIGQTFFVFYKQFLILVIPYNISLKYFLVCEIVAEKYCKARKDGIAFYTNISVNPYHLKKTFIIAVPYYVYSLCRLYIYRGHSNIHLHKES
jgi:hypothetical protein